MIIHSPTISGSLIFAEGATFTLPDGGNFSGSFSGSIQVHEVTSHIIPDTNETYDLGSPTNRFRDIYLSNNTIKFPGGAFGIGPSGDFTLEDANGDPAAVISKELKIADPVSGDVVVFKVVNGQLETTATDSNGTAIADPKSNLSGSFSGSFAIENVTTDILPIDNEVQSLGSPTKRFAEIYLSNNSAKFPSGSFGMNDFGDFTLEDNDGDATSLITSVLKLKDTVTDTIYSITATNDVVEVSTDVSVSGNITVTGTVDGVDVAALKGNVDAILSGSQADKDSFAEIVSLINSVDTTNDNAFASFYTASNDRLDSIEGFTSSIDTTIKTKLNTETVISGSSQVQIGSVTGFTSFSSSVDSRIESLDSNLDTNIKNKLNSENVLSGSITEAQISDFGSYVTTDSLQALSTGSDALTFSSNILTLTRGDGSTDTVDLSAYLDEDSRSISSGVVDGLTGIVTFTRDDASTFTLDLSTLLDDTNSVTSVAGKTGVVTLDTDDVSEGSTNIYFSDFRVKEKLNTEGVISGSSQITINESQITDLDHFTISDLPSGTVSGSSQVVIGDTDGFTAFSSSVANTFDGLSSNYEDLVGIPSGIVSGSSQVDLASVTGNSTSNVSEGTNLYYTDVRVKAKLNAENVISSSAQVLSDIFGEDLQLGDITGSNLYLSGNAIIAGNVTIGDTANDTISFAADVSSDILPSATNTYDLGSSTDKFAEVHATNFYGITNGVVNATNGVISGSSQLDSENLNLGIVTGSDIRSTGNVFAGGYIQSEDGLYVSINGGASSFSVNETGNTVIRGTLDIGSAVNGISDVSASIAANVASITSHEGRSDNPHSVTAAQVGLGNVDNTSDANKPISTATQTALDLKATVSALNTEVGRIDAILATADADKDSFAEIVTLINSVDTTNDSAFAGFVTSSNAAQAVQDGRLSSLETQSGSISSDLSTHIADTDNPHSVTATQVGLGNVTNESKSTMFTSPTFTGTVSGVTATHVGLGNVTNESKSTMFTSPTFTGTVSGVTKAMVGLGNVDNTADSAKPVSTAQQTALDLKYDASNPSGFTTYTSNQATNTTSGVTFASVAGGTITGTSVSVTGDVVAYASSDSRLKDNVKNIENPIQKVQSLNGVTWDWNDNADELQKSIPNVGVIAQEVEQVLPQLVKDRENGYKGVDYAKLTGLLIEAVKEQQKQIDELKSRLG